MGITLPGEPGIDYEAMAANKDAVVKRMWTGLKSLVTKNKVTLIEGRGRLDGPTKIRVSQPGEDGTPGKGGERVLQATDVILATGLAGQVAAGPGPERDDGSSPATTSCGRPACPRTSSSSAPGRSASSSPACSTTSASA